MCNENNKEVNETMLNLEPELNFISESNLSRNGMIKEIKTEFNIIRLCLSQMSELDGKYLSMLDRILVMPLRKLLCEKNSVLLKVVPNFKMPPLTGSIIDLHGKLKMISPSLSIEPTEKWLPVGEWLQKDIAYFDRTVNDLPDGFHEFVYRCILNKLKKSEKQNFEAMFRREVINYHGESSVVYIRVQPNNSTADNRIFNYLEQIGYNHLSIYNFLKHQSDKRGAHIDVGYCLVVEIINSPIYKKITMILWIAIQMIYAGKIQIPELENYWPEMPIVVEEANE